MTVTVARDAIKGPGPRAATEYVQIRVGVRSAKHGVVINARRVVGCCDWGRADSYAAAIAAPIAILRIIAFPVCFAEIVCRFSALAARILIRRRVMPMSYVTSK